jgi:hypothetical protein
MIRATLISTTSLLRCHEHAVELARSVSGETSMPIESAFTSGEGSRAMTDDTKRDIGGRGHSRNCDQHPLGVSPSRVRGRARPIVEWGDKRAEDNAFASSEGSRAVTDDTKRDSRSRQASHRLRSAPPRCFAITSTRSSSPIVEWGDNRAVRDVTPPRVPRFRADRNFRIAMRASAARAS